jgi:hypothetical protein
MKKLSLLMLLVATYGFSQCPVQVTKAYTRGFHHETRLETPSMKIHYRNTSDKVILGVKFGAYYVNAVDDAEASYNTFTDDQKVAPGKSKYAEWHQYDTNKIKRPVVYVMKVKFDDGTLWEDNGDRICSFKQN